MAKMSANNLPKTAASIHPKAGETGLVGRPPGAMAEGFNDPPKRRKSGFAIPPREIGRSSQRGTSHRVLILTKPLPG